MDNTQILTSMIKQHKEVYNNLDRLDGLYLKCNTEIGTDKDIKNYNKLLKQTKKLFSTLSMSYNMIAKQKMNLPQEFFEIGTQIDEFKEQLNKFKEIN